jgi:cytoskeletal protein CcmA (bactofilin family)
MANTRKAESARRRGVGAANGVVDSYAAIKAAGRAVKSRGVVAPVPDASSDELQKLGAQVRQGAVPTKQLIECYECGYRFQLHGKVPKTNCNKCRATLDLADHTIANRWSGTLKTAGSVRVTADGIVEAGSIIANDFILEGKVEAGIVRAMRRLELRPSARFSEHNLEAPDLLIAAAATIALIEPAEYRNVEIYGTLRANLQATGTVTVHTGGLLQGELHGERLVVNEGGGLQARVCVALVVRSQSRT